MHRRSIDESRRALEAGFGPNVDFGKWDPNCHRLLKKIHNTGQQRHDGGVLKAVEMSGPLGLHTQLECYRLFTTGVVGFRPSRDGTTDRLWKIDCQLCAEVWSAAIAVSMRCPLLAGTHGND